MSQAEKTDSDNSEFHTSISLIARVRDRSDVESWREFYQFYQPLLTRYLRRLGLDDHTTNDVIQDVFVRLLQSLPSFELDKKRGRFRGYLWKLTYTALVDQARRVKARRQAEEEWVKRFQGADEAESRKLHQELNEISHQQILAKALPRVRSVTSPTAWSCFEQRLLRDRPGSVIAAELGITDKAVFVYASRVLKAVRRSAPRSQRNWGMSRATGCLEEPELLVLLSGEPASELLRAHLDECPDCRSRLDLLQRELSAIRLTGEVSAPSDPVSTDRDPGPTSCDRSSAGALVESRESSTKTMPSTTQPWPDDAPNAASRARAEPSAAAEEESIPAAIGKYLVVGRFPRSGQAQVFRVVHPELRRDLVLKLAHQPIDEDGRSDVIVDGERLAELEHPNIVRVHDLDFYEGRPYLVMEYVRGRTLAQYTRDEPVSPRQAAAMVAEIAGAIAFAHRRGIVHQDIKPANVLVDEAGRPRLIDFGLAWRQDAWSGSTTQSEGGTFAYMAPEQARVELDRVRPLSDVFALGSLLFFLLTGKAPFDAATPDESWDRARRCNFDRSALKNAGVPRPLERICKQAMDCEPQRRFPSAARLEHALRQYFNWRWIANAAATAGLFIVALAAVMLTYPWQTPRTATPTPAPAPSFAPASPAVAAGPVRIINLNIDHMAQSGKDAFEPRGKLGERSFAVRFGDDVTVHAELSEAAYAYLIAFRPDGVDEICDPEQSAAPPAKTKEPRYPPAAKTGKVYRLEDGAGLHAFALVVSRFPLPPYEDWKKQHGTPRWKKGASSPAGVVWWHDGRSLAPLTAGDPSGTRGKDAPIRGGGNAVVDLADWLRAIPGVDAVAVKAFPVPPASGP